jgi:hypothetical protein
MGDHSSANSAATITTQTSISGGQQPPPSSSHVVDGVTWRSQLWKKLFNEDVPASNPATGPPPHHLRASPSSTSSHDDHSNSNDARASNNNNNNIGRTSTRGNYFTYPSFALSLFCSEFDERSTILY